MPLISGPVDWNGALVVVLVGVSKNRRAKLQQLSMPVPSPIPLRLQVDTGSHLTGFPAAVFNTLEVGSFGKIRVGTPSTKPGESHYACQFDVSLTLVSGIDQRLFPSVHAIASDDFTEEVQGILGRDVLDQCVFEYHGTHHSFRLFF
jgi:hypothetical protein